LRTPSKKALSPRELRIKHLQEIVLFPMLGALMFCSKIIMEALPNIHLLGMLTMVFTIVFRAKALIPIYIYVMTNGLYAGFSVWWFPYLYIWTILWGITMLLPRKMPRKWATVIYPLLCALHGFAFGILYSPAQAIMFGMNFRQTLLWVASGIPFDILHGIGNLAAGLLILPLSELLTKLLKRNSLILADV
jgi:energy-coupling factor transport system substrate-specific component